MTRWLQSLFVVSLTFVQAAMAGEGQGGLVLVNMAAVPASLFDAVAGNVSTNLFCHVRATSTNAYGGDKAKALGELGRFLGTDDPGVIALVNVKGDLAFHDAVSESRKVALLNIAVLQGGAEGRDMRVGGAWFWRIEKQATALAGRLLGLDTCPFPLCALYACDSMEEIDKKGRNLCPPCQMKVEELMKDQGLFLSPPTEVPRFLPEDK